MAGGLYPGAPMVLASLLLPNLLGLEVRHLHLWWVLPLPAPLGSCQSTNLGCATGSRCTLVTFHPQGTQTDGPSNTSLQPAAPEAGVQTGKPFCCPSCKCPPIPLLIDQRPLPSEVLPAYPTAAMSRPSPPSALGAQLLVGEKKKKNHINRLHYSPGVSLKEQNLQPCVCCPLSPGQHGAGDKETKLKSGLQSHTRY